MGKNLTCEERERIAYARHQIILPLIRLSREERVELIKEIARNKHDLGYGKKRRVSKRTLWRWIRRFTEGGLKGLWPEERSDKGKIRVIDDTRLNKALELKKELPKRSTYKVIRLMELEKEIREGEIKGSTLSRIFQEKGYTRRELTGIEPKVRRRFQREKVNSLRQGDLKDGI